jgi:hypothetical protein
MLIHLTHLRSALRCVTTAIAAGAALAACGGSSTAKVTRTVTVPTRTTPTQSTSPKSATGSSGSANAALSADEAAEALANMASTAATSYGTSHNGNYAGLSAAVLHALDDAIQVGPGGGDPYLASSGGVVVLGDGAGYTATATSTSGDTFSVGESASGTPTRSCTGTASGACQAGTWVGDSGGTAAPG